jgi:hypothetical protein
MEESRDPNQFLAKVLSGLFVAVIAPILTGVALWYIQKKLDDPKPDAPAPAPVADLAKGQTKAVPKPAPDPSPSLATTTAPAPKPAPSPSPSPQPAFPKKKRAGPVTVRLFNGRDLTGFDTFLGKPHGGGPAYGRNNDPEHVFTVRAGELHVSGKVFGGLLTTRNYENYRLTVEYRWGEKRWPPREELPRLGGIVLHASGPPGAVRGWTMEGIMCLISENDTGALIIPESPTNPVSLTFETERIELKKAGRSAYVYKPGEPRTTLQSGTIHRLGFRPVMAKAAAGKAAVGKSAAGKPAAVKGANDFANPVGEWNTLECACEGDRITVSLNGKVVNVATRSSLSRGQIFFESQGAEIFFRRIDLRLLTSAGSLAARGDPARASP